MKVVLRLNERQRCRIAVSIALGAYNNQYSGAFGYTAYGGGDYRDEFHWMKWALRRCFNEKDCRFGWVTTAGNRGTIQGHLLTLETTRHALWQSGLWYIMRGLDCPQEEENAAYRRVFDQMVEDMCLKPKASIPPEIYRAARKAANQVKDAWGEKIPVKELISMSDSPWWHVGVKPRIPLAAPPKGLLDSASPTPSPHGRFAREKSLKRLQRSNGNRYSFQDVDSLLDVNRLP